MEVVVAVAVVRSGCCGGCSESDSDGDCVIAVISWLLAWNASASRDSNDGQSRTLSLVVRGGGEVIRVVGSRVVGVVVVSVAEAGGSSWAYSGISTGTSRQAPKHKVHDGSPVSPTVTTTNTYPCLPRRRTLLAGLRQLRRQRPPLPLRQPFQGDGAAMCKWGGGGCGCGMRGKRSRQIA